MFEVNYGEANGGAIYSYGPTIKNISNTRFTGNQARLNGGSLYMSTFDMTNCRFTGSWAGSLGGAIYITHSEPASSKTITDCEFQTCSSRQFGGVIYGRRYTLTRTRI